MGAHVLKISSPSTDIPKYWQTNKKDRQKTAKIHFNITSHHA
jgi:hypothetical protein